MPFTVDELLSSLPSESPMLPSCVSDRGRLAELIEAVEVEGGRNVCCCPTSMSRRIEIHIVFKSG